MKKNRNFINFRKNIKKKWNPSGLKQIKLKTEIKNKFKNWINNQKLKERDTKIQITNKEKK